LQIAAGSRNHPHVHSQGLGAAQSLELSFLKDPEQFRLQLWRQLADFVEEDCGRVSKLEPPNLTGQRARVSAFLTAKKLAFDQSAGSAAQLIRTIGRSLRRLSS